MSLDIEPKNKPVVVNVNVTVVNSHDGKETPEPKTNDDKDVDGKNFSRWVEEQKLREENDRD